VSDSNLGVHIPVLLTAKNRTEGILDVLKDNMLTKPPQLSIDYLVRFRTFSKRANVDRNLFQIRIAQSI
jgi:hypothetical protein